MKKIIYLFILLCLTFTMVSCTKETKFENLATEEEIINLFDIFKNMVQKGYNYEYEYDINELRDTNTNRMQVTSNIEGKVIVNKNGAREYDVNYTQKYKILQKNIDVKSTYERTARCVDCFDDYKAFYLLTVERKSKDYTEKTTTKSIVDNISNKYNYENIFSSFDPLCNYIDYFYSSISYNNSHLKKFIVFKEENVYKCILSTLDYKEEYIIYIDNKTHDTVTKVEYLKKFSNGSAKAVLKTVSDLTINPPKDYETYLD